MMGLIRLHATRRVLRALLAVVTLLGVQSVIGSRDQGGVPAQPKRIGDRLAAQIVGSGVVRRIEIGQDQNFHKPGPELKRAGRFLPA